MDETPTLTEREEIEALLAWYATGRLSRDERARVDAYLARHPEMRRQLAMIDEDRRVTVEDNEGIAAPRSLTADALLARLPRRDASLIERLVAPLRDLFTAPTASGVRWAAAAAAAAFVLQGVLIGTLTGPRTGGDYETASGGIEAAGRSATVLVRFTPDAGLATVAEALAKREMRIVDGPKPGGLFVVAIGPASLGVAEREARAGELRALTGLVALVLAGEGAGGK